MDYTNTDALISNGACTNRQQGSYSYRYRDTKIHSYRYRRRRADERTLPLGLIPGSWLPFDLPLRGH